ncbi:DegT/DnrJ/EryC1/StrS family aminotransferase [Actinotalea solisilvae]|uniref:DegT/DnrJ/EryC1/StrS family aminotransferase n=1 Tax=Actinotalea solisilvae TaxID=2072922 RepID=UPI0018F1814C|nr:DegT/DnrJ/EryC1/StrS family aminotransferase [Actinotalea solisilvae]
MASTALDRPVYVTRPVIPPWENLEAALRRVFDSGILTNMGPAHVELEERLEGRLGAGHLSLWNNGTTALLGALSQLDLHDQAIVTPFTFPATVHALSLLGIEPVFADVDPHDLTLSAESVAERLTDRVSAVVGTHVYGNFCDTAAIARLRDERRPDLRIVYDGAHIFGRSGPVFDSAEAIGDVTMLSFHATKLFHTVEGGALVTPEAAQQARFRTARNFGITGEESVEGVGLNGKMSEVHAAVGLAVLDVLDAEIDARAALARQYVERLDAVDGLEVLSGRGPSYQYLTVRVRTEEAWTRDSLRSHLLDHGIVSRKYFHPLCSEMDAYRHLRSAADLPHATAAARECLVLPLYGEMTPDLVDTICDLVDAKRAAA